MSAAQDADDLRRKALESGAVEAAELRGLADEVEEGNLDASDVEAIINDSAGSQG